MHTLSNWRYSTVTTQTTTDAGQGTPILTSGDAPKLVIQLSQFNGTNTTAVNMKYFIAALSAVNPDTAGQYDITGLNFFPLGFMNADSSTSANDPMEPVAVQPFGAKGAGGSNGFMMPPNAILIAAPGINQNGSIVHQAISADL
jgi:hypothetical protein